MDAILFPLGQRSVRQQPLPEAPVTTIEFLGLSGVSPANASPAMAAGRAAPGGTVVTMDAGLYAYAAATLPAFDAAAGWLAMGAAFDGTRTGPTAAMRLSCRVWDGVAGLGTIPTGVRHAYASYRVTNPPADIRTLFADPLFLNTSSSVTHRYPAIANTGFKLAALLGVTINGTLIGAHPGLSETERSSSGNGAPGLRVAASPASIPATAQADVAMVDATVQIAFGCNVRIPA